MNPKDNGDWTQGSRLAAASLGLMERTDEASRYVERILETQPGFTVGGWARKHPSTSAERLVNPLARGMLAAGLPK